MVHSAESKTKKQSKDDDDEKHIFVSLHWIESALYVSAVCMYGVGVHK